MSERESSPSKDAYVQKLSNARNARAVIKTEFAAWASGIPAARKIFAFEGRNDKSAYFHWIRAISADVAYEPYICKNKNNVLKLFDSLQLDLTGMGGRVFYFVDRDFDGLQGRPQHEKIFITQAYSIENYLVNVQVLDDILCVTFHCEGVVRAREKVTKVFSTVYQKFLQVTEGVNFRLYVAKRNMIGRSEDISAGINDIANVGLTEVGPGWHHPHEVVKLVREPSRVEMEDARASFLDFDPSSDYRGKFALMFFIKWLELLRRDRLSEQPTVFDAVAPTEHKVSGAFSFEVLTAFAKPPEELVTFLNSASL